jgi:hypothetical protein
MFIKIENRGHSHQFPQAAKVVPKQQYDFQQLPPKKPVDKALKISNTIEGDNTNHFVTNHVDLTTCSKPFRDYFDGNNQQNDFNGISGKIVIEDDKDGVNFEMVIEGQTFQYYQICFANHVDHQHSFKITLNTIANTATNISSTMSQNLQHLSQPAEFRHVSQIFTADCDMFLSASDYHPSSISW